MRQMDKFGSKLYNLDYLMISYEDLFGKLWDDGTY